MTAGTAQLSALSHVNLGPVKSQRISWAANASAETEEISIPLYLNGTMVGYSFIEGATAPTAAANLTIEDSDGQDILNGTGSAIATGTPGTITRKFVADLEDLPVDTKSLTLKYNNAVNNASAVIIIYTR